MARRPHFASWLAVAAALLCAATLAASQAAQAPAYTTRFYARGDLQLQSYLFLPSRAGAVPLVVYNHGSRVGAERTERPFTWIARALTSAGYAVLVPERRGYGQSGGRTFTEEVGDDRAAAFISRLQAETDDALAAVDDVMKTSAGRIDGKRLAMIGWSFGGIITTLGGAQDPRFGALIVQAPGALNWGISPALRTALLDAAGRIRTPLQCMVATNDATVESAKQICARAQEAHGAATYKEYPAFTPPQPSTIPPGHLLFGVDGISVWGKDAIAFLDAAFKR